MVSKRKRRKANESEQISEAFHIARLIAALLAIDFLLRTLVRLLLPVPGGIADFIDQMLAVLLYVVLPASSFLAIFGLLIRVNIIELIGDAIRKKLEG